MANQEFLDLLKSARAGDVASQLALGKIYLSGGYRLSPNPKSALLWLSRAALANSLDARLLIGRVFPPELTRQLNNPEFVRLCYRTAAQAGVAQAQIWLDQLDAKKIQQVLRTYIINKRPFLRARKGLLPARDVSSVALPLPLLMNCYLQRKESATLQASSASPSIASGHAEHTDALVHI